jgi:hypothetical protein
MEENTLLYPTFVKAINNCSKPCKDEFIEELENMVDSE